MTCALRPLFGISQGCPYTIRYATEHPEQVTCLVLLGGYLRGRLNWQNPQENTMHEAAGLMIRDGWGSNSPVFRHFFTTMFMPDAPPGIAAHFDELQRIATSSENALRIWDMTAHIDVSHAAPHVRAPTLVLHCQGDRMVPIAEGRLVAKMIPGAAFVELPGNNHLLLDGTPALDQFFEEVAAFLERCNH